jgi:hypothetical protein
MFFRKFEEKEIFEARQCADPEDPHEIAKWCNGRVCGVGHVGEKVRIAYLSPQGDILEANYGDWIIKIGENKFYDLPDLFFKKEYSPV